MLRCRGGAPDLQALLTLALSQSPFLYPCMCIAYAKVHSEVSFKPISRYLAIYFGLFTVSRDTLRNQRAAFHGYPGWVQPSSGMFSWMGFDLEPCALIVLHLCI